MGERPLKAPSRAIPLASRMNKTEGRFNTWLMLNPDYTEIEFEVVKFRIAKKCWYTPDFFARPTVHLRPHIFDVKARNKKTGKPIVTDDALVKIKACAERFKWAEWAIAWEDGSGGGWEFRWFE